jgi:hypothetical protein
MNDKHPFDQEDQEIITMLQATGSPISPDARRRIWKTALAGIPPRRNYRWVGRLPFALAAFGLVMFVFVLAVRPLLDNQNVGATAMVMQTPAPTVQPRDGIKSQYLVEYTKRGTVEDYSFNWYQSPDLLRIETYSTSTPDALSSISESLQESLAKQLLATLPIEAKAENFKLVNIGLHNADRFWAYYDGVFTLNNPVLDSQAKPYRLRREATNLRGQAALDELLRRYSARAGAAKLIGTETILGRTAWVIDGYDAFNYSVFSRRKRLWVDQEQLFHLKTITYDRDGGIESESKIIEIAINQPIPPSVFGIDLPVELWRNSAKKGNNGTFNNFVWQLSKPEIPFTLHTVEFKGGLAEKIILSPPQYDALANRVTAFGVSTDDPFGSPILGITQTPATNNRAAQNSDRQGISAAEVTGFGFIQTVDSKHTFHWIVDGTQIQITADAAVVTRDEFVVITNSLSYVPPVANGYIWMKTWQNIAQVSDFAVFAPGYGVWVKPDSNNALLVNSATLFPDPKFIVGLPTNSGQSGIRQEFYLKNRAGVVVVMTQGKYSLDYSTWQPDTTFTDEEAWYKVDGDRQYLAVIKEGTTILFEAWRADVAKDDLNQIWFYLRRVPVPEAGK